MQNQIWYLVKLDSRWLAVWDYETLLIHKELKKPVLIQGNWDKIKSSNYYKNYKIPV